jgi:hypothetical protein
MNKIFLGLLLVGTMNGSPELAVLEKELPPDYLWILKTVTQSPASNVVVDDVVLKKQIFRWKYWSYETHNFMIRSACESANLALLPMRSDIWKLGTLISSLDPSKSNLMLCVNFDEKSISVEVKENPKSKQD